MADADHPESPGLTPSDALQQLAELDARNGGDGALTAVFSGLVEELAAQTTALKRQRLLYTTIVEAMREIALKALDMNRFEQYTLNTIRGHFGVLKLWFFRQADYGEKELGVYTARMVRRPELRIRLDGAFGDWCRLHPWPIDLAGNGDLDDMQEAAELHKLGAAIALPLVKQDEAGDRQLVGVLGLGPRIGNLPYSADDREFLSLLGSMVGVTLHNAHLYQRSIIDNLTRVYSRGHFDIHLEQEISRARRFNEGAEREEKPDSTGVALVMLDIDHFKEFNDRYGHQIGDEVLAHVAARLKTASRSMDIVCRYGGEEFGVIFPDVTPEDALRIAERLRAAVADEKVETKEFGPLTVTASVGVATWPTHASDARTLVARADEALYKAKSMGRNRVVQAASPDSQPVAG